MIKASDDHRILSLEQATAVHIVLMLRKYSGNRAKISKVLKVPETTLRRRMKELGIRLGQPRMTKDVFVDGGIFAGE